MSAGRLIVWRHGRTEWNLQDKMQGQADIPLDEVGIEQARVAAARLASSHRPASSPATSSAPPPPPANWQR